MYHLNYNPDPKYAYVIKMDPMGKFWQLIGDNIGVVAESNSWRELKKYAELNKLKLTLFRY